MGVDFNPGEVPDSRGLRSYRDGAVAVTAIATIVGDLGLSTATLQFREIDHEQVTNLFWIDVALGGVLGLAIYAFVPAVAPFYRDPRLASITMAFSTTFLSGGLRVHTDAHCG